MTKTIILPLLLTTILVACDREHALKRETFYFKEENKGWVKGDPVRMPFMMMDDNLITSSFSLNDSTCYFGESWGTNFGIYTHYTLKEYCYLSFRSTYGTTFSISLTAGSPPLGDYIFIHLNGVEFMYDLDTETIVSLYTPFGTRSRTITDTGYEENEPIHSTVELLDSLLVGGRFYHDVMHFYLKDFSEQWGSYTPIDIFVAKSHGLIQYNLSCGLTCSRKP
jgi:hypothetical protein